MFFMMTFLAVGVIMVGLSLTIFSMSMIGIGGWE